MPGSKAAFNIVIVLIVVGLIGIILPSEFRVEQDIVIDAQPSDIYPYLVDLRKWQQWTSWAQSDESAIYTFDGPDRAIGMRFKWQSELLGRGVVAIEALQFNQKLSYSIHNITRETEAIGEIRLKPEGNQTRITWISQGDVGLNIIARYRMLSYEDRIAKEIIVGLENIKVLVENNRASL